MAIETSVKRDDYYFEVKIVDSSHCFIRVKGNDNWGSAYHVRQVPDDTLSVLKKQGLFDGKFFLVKDK